MNQDQNPTESTPTIQKAIHEAVRETMSACLDNDQGLSRGDRNATFAAVKAQFPAANDKELSKALADAFSRYNCDTREFDDAEVEAAEVRCKRAEIHTLASAVKHLWAARIDEETSFFHRHDMGINGRDNQKMISRATADCRARFPMLSDDDVYKIVHTPADQIDELQRQGEYPDFTW